MLVPSYMQRNMQHNIFTRGSEFRMHHSVVGKLNCLNWLNSPVSKLNAELRMTRPHWNIYDSEAFFILHYFACSCEHRLGLLQRYATFPPNLDPTPHPHPPLAANQLWHDTECMPARPGHTETDEDGCDTSHSHTLPSSVAGHRVSLETRWMMSKSAAR